MKNVLLVLSCLVVSSFSATAFANPSPEQCSKMKRVQEILQVQSQIHFNLQDAARRSNQSLATICKKNLSMINEYSRVQSLVKDGSLGTGWLGDRAEAIKALSSSSGEWGPGACDQTSVVPGRELNVLETNLETRERNAREALKFVKRAVRTNCK